MRKPIEERLNDLLSRMTLEEKVKLLDMYSGSDLAVKGNLDRDKTTKAINNSRVGSAHDY